MTIRVLINGAAGRMGQVTSTAIMKAADLTLAGQTDRQDNLAEAIAATAANVVVDFTEPAAAYQNTVTIIRSGAHPVIGTTGLTTAQITELQSMCHKLQLGGIIAPNFSLGVAMLLKYAQELVTYFPQVTIIEMHNTHKKDAPSGTALYTATKLANARDNSKIIDKTATKFINQDIAIHSVRLPGIISQQQIIFGSCSETITLRHDSIDRQSFMPGVCLACTKVIQLKELVYGLEAII